MNILFLDDDKERHHIFDARISRFDRNVVQVHTYAEVVEKLMSDVAWDVVFLDHDLNNFEFDSSMPGVYGGKTELTGADVARFIAYEMPHAKRTFRVVIHSWNPPGAERMYHILHDVSIPVIRQVFSESIDL